MSAVPEPQPTPQLKEAAPSPIKALGDSIFNGKKHRRASSEDKDFVGDHFLISDNPDVQNIMSNLSGEHILFADRVTRLTDHNHMADCYLIVSESHVLILNSRLQGLLTAEPIKISTIESISSSTETDNAIVIHIPHFQSELVLSSCKVELTATIVSRYSIACGHDLPVKFANIIEFPVGPSTIFEVDFVRSSDGVKMTLFCKADPNAVQSQFQMGSHSGVKKPPVAAEANASGATQPKTPELQQPKTEETVEQPKPAEPSQENPSEPQLPKPAEPSQAKPPEPQTPKAEEAHPAKQTEPDKK